jgi:Ca2+-transporting ATPase
MLMVLALVALVLAGSLVWPLARELFRFGPLHGDDLLIVAGAGIVMLSGLEMVKLLRPLATAPRGRA